MLQDLRSMEEMNDWTRGRMHQETSRRRGEQGEAELRGRTGGWPLKSRKHGNTDAARCLAGQMPVCTVQELFRTRSPCDNIQRTVKRKKSSWHQPAVLLRSDTLLTPPVKTVVKWTS
jgi:hypothetical protein